MATRMSLPLPAWACVACALVVTLLATACGDSASAGAASTTDASAAADDAASDDTVDGPAPDVGADGVSSVPGDAGTLEIDDAGEAGPPPVFALHEWGTFTSFQGSNGTAVAGLHHAEEALPSFVEPTTVGAAGAAPDVVLATGVTRRLQTPALFVHADGAAFDLDVRLELPDGILTTAWPPASALSFDEPTQSQGAAEWSLAIGEGGGLQAEEGDLWSPMRGVAADRVTAVGETEGFVFHGGVDRGVFPISLTSLDEEVITLVNEDHATLDRAWYVHVHEGGALIWDLGKVTSTKTFLATPTPKETDPPAFIAAARTQIEAALVDAGLFEDEAQALVDVWHVNAFSTFGRRLLYLVPDAWVDAALPVDVAPLPYDHRRVYVGRIEFMTPGDEQAVLDMAAARDGAGPPDVLALGPFAEPKVRRALAIAAGDADLEAALDELLAAAEALP